MTKQVSFKFEAGLLRRVDEAAQAAKLNRSQLVFRLLEQGLANSSQPTLGVDLWNNVPDPPDAPKGPAKFFSEEEIAQTMHDLCTRNRARALEHLQRKVPDGSV